MADLDDAAKPDLKIGVSLDGVADGGMILGRVDDEDVILARRGDDLFAVGAHCTHYHAPLADGLIAADTLRCPWHHACFSLRTGEALSAPALDPIACWRVERVGNSAFVRERMSAPRPANSRSRGTPDAVVIVGGGAAGLAAADMLRREGYDGGVTLISADDLPPCDRPNLSKDYLAGTAQEDWIPLRPAAYYTERRIELMLASRVSAPGLHRQSGGWASGRVSSGSRSPPRCAHAGSMRISSCLALAFALRLPWPSKRASPLTAASP